ncbi:hypothetical protein LCGC14_1736240 [marine sediment metagenome]|uniref:Uncharacterized protein n=1 Tax=marine sediment metagenome TaxID=412755 RepID=A0A0F9H7X4_9ZZZZ
MKDKVKIEKELKRLNKVEFIRPTALELHQARGAMLGRIQRKEDKRYFKEVEKRKVELKKKLLDLKEGKPIGKLSKSPERTLTRMETKPRMRMGRYGH